MSVNDVQITVSKEDEFGSMLFSDINEVQSYVQKEYLVKQEKIKDVPENERIKLDDDTIYRFSCTVSRGYLTLKLAEIGAFAPYIYERVLTLKEIQNNYKMFRSCDDLEKVQYHILKLFNDKRIKLKKEKEDYIKFILNVDMISINLDIEIEAKRIMTTKKDDALLKLYEIEKKQLKLLKEIEISAKKLGNNNFIEKINELKKKYQ
jgi:hypothetical protein